MSERGQKKDKWANRLAAIGIIVVVAALAVAVYVRSSALTAQHDRYEAIEESLDAAIEDEKRYANELKERKVYVKTKEYVIEKAREIFDLKMPDEIIVKPEN